MNDSLQVRTVMDAGGVVHRLQGIIGQPGGQGTVYRTTDGAIAVKLITTPHPSLRQRIERIRALPLWGVPISRPLIRIEREGECAGYAMDLLTNVESAYALISSAEEMDGPELSVWYSLTSGGLLRRLRLLSRAADTLAWLHSRSLIYADPSPNNILVSRDVNSTDVWIIDPDNIGFPESPLGEQDSGTLSTVSVLTPGYGAPELSRGEAYVSTMTDVFAFGVLAFEALTLVHPFAGGDFVHDGPCEREEQAYRGEFPWIDDPEDESNRSSRGIPREWVLSRRLKDIAQATFGPGRSDPRKRPNLSQWAESLAGAADMVLRCMNCDSTFYSSEVNCTWCDAARPAFRLMTMHPWIPPREKGGVGSIVPESRLCAAVIPQPGKLVVTERMARAVGGPEKHLPLVEVSVSRDAHLQLTPIQSGDLWLSTLRGSDPVPLDKPKEIPIRWSLHFGAPDAPHRVATFL
jgi:eukaryotic-like serine/threonine-protein kinase